MVRPMREKRTWPPQDRDADGETVAAFEAAVAVVKETVVRSGEVLVSAKEDLSDHQRWLKAQTEAVRADRQRHERWLQRQRERQEALERREQRRARRGAMRQAYARSVKDAALAAVFAMRSAVWFVVSKIVLSLNYIDALALSGVSWVLRGFRDPTLYIARAVSKGLGFAGRRVVDSGVSRIAAKAWVPAPAAVKGLSAGFGGIAARARDASRATRRWLAAGFSFVSAKAGVLAHRASERLVPASRGLSAKVYRVAPSLWDKVAHAGIAARRYAREGTARIREVLPRNLGTRVEGQNAIFLPKRIGGVDLSQMLIIAGALLLVLGGLMLGGGLILRAGTPSSPIAEATPSEPIGWLFEHKNFPIAERSIFLYEATPSGARIKGFSITAVNMSEETLDSVGGEIRPDLHNEDFKLSVIVGKPGEEGVAMQISDVASAGVQSGTVPPQAPFKLVFVFPGAEGGDGMTPEEVVTASGGLTLKVHYTTGGKEKSFIQYLPAPLLEDQLAEITAEAKGS